MQDDVPAPHDLLEGLVFGSRATVTSYVQGVCATPKHLLPSKRSEGRVGYRKSYLSCWVQSTLYYLEVVDHVSELLCSSLPEGKSKQVEVSSSVSAAFMRK